MRRLDVGLKSLGSFDPGTEIIVFFAPPVAATGVAAGAAMFPTWRVKVKWATEDALAVEHGKDVIGLSWDHIAGIQFV